MADPGTGWHFDPAAVRAGFASAADAYARTVAAIAPGAFDRPGLGVWSVRDLAGHTGRALTTVEQYLAAPGPGPVTLGHPLDYMAILASAHADPEAVAERGRAAGRALGPDPAAAAAELAARVTALVAGTPDDTPVATPAGTMRLIDYLPARCFELVVHRLDLERAAGLDPVDDPEGLAVVAVLVGGMLARHPDAAAAFLALTGRIALPKGFSIV
jgi:uncharacterized protein (TIGR03083 family)